MTLYPAKFCVYYHKIGNAVFYIGSGVSSRPFSLDGRTETWKSYINNNGGAYTIEICRWYSSRKLALKREKKEIENLKPSTNREQRFAEINPKGYQSVDRHRALEEYKPKV
jgi:hypothetical protein